MSESGQAFLFELIGDQMIPMPRELGIVPDGIRFFDADGAAERTGRTRATMVSEWLLHVGRRIDLAELPEDPTDDGSVADVPPPVDAGDPVAVAAEQVALNVVRRMKFARLDNEQWQFVLNECRKYRIDPTMVWTRMERRDDGERELMVVLRIHAVRGICARHGRLDETRPEFLGADGMWVQEWNQPGHPVAARVLVNRRGFDVAFEGIAYWEFQAQYEEAPGGGRQLNRFWRDGGPHMLGKCASAYAHRLGWPEQLAGIYTDAEITPDGRIRGPERLGGGVPTRGAEPLEQSPAMSALVAQAQQPIDPPDDTRYAADLVDDSTPDSESRLKIELMEIGVTPMAKAAAVIDLFRHKFPRVHRASTRAFCALTLKCVKDNPAFYGVAEAMV